MYNEVIAGKLRSASEAFASLAFKPAVYREFEAISPAEMRDMVFFVTMVPLSIYNMRTFFTYPFDGSPMGVQLQVFVSASQASGKSWADRIQRRIMERMRVYNNAELNKLRDYERRKAAAKNLKEAPPHTCVFLLPPATSKTKLCKRALDIEYKFGEEAPVYVYTFSPELGTALESNRNAYTDMRTVNRISYDGGPVGSDCNGEFSFDGEVCVSQSLLYLGTPGVMSRYFNHDAIENGNLSRAIVVPFEQEIGAGAPKFGRLNAGQEACIDRILNCLFDNVFDPRNENRLMPKQHLDMGFLTNEMNSFQDTARTEAVSFKPFVGQMQMADGCMAIDTFRKRSSVSAMRIAAICHNMYLTENMLLPCKKRLSETQIRESVRVIFRFAAYYILHSTLMEYGDIAEAVLHKFKSKGIGGRPIFDLLPANFLKSDVQYFADKFNMKSPARIFINKWKETDRIIELDDGSYQKKSEQGTLEFGKGAVNS